MAVAKSAPQANISADTERRAGLSAIAEPLVKILQLTDSQGSSMYT